MSNLDRYKFRGKRLDGNGWIYGCLHYKDSSDYAAIEFTDFGKLAGQPLRKVRRVDPATVGQWTGKQVNGVDLYEGDIIANGTGRTGEVIWYDNAACWDTRVICGKGRAIGMAIAGLYDVEITGNIHEEKAK